MTPRERAAAALAAWRGDGLGCIAHLLAEVERLNGLTEGENMTTQNAADDEMGQWLKPAKVRIRRSEDGRIVLQLESASGVTFYLPMLPATASDLARALRSAVEHVEEVPRG